jgi:hypothetical protein
MVRVGNISRCGVLSVAIVGLGFAAPVSARAAANRPITGGYTVTSIAAGTVPVQMITGVNGTIWFVTATSQLGTIAPDGVATLTSVTLPEGSGFSGSMAADLVSAGPEGEWAISNGASPSGGCVVSLAEPDGHVLQRVPNHPTNPECGGGARDADGNLWVSLHGGGSSGLAEVTPSGVITVTQAPLTNPPPYVALGNDGALWTYERADANNGDLAYGHFVPGGSVTTIPVFGPDTPPVPGSVFGLHVRPARDVLLPRPDGTFWAVTDDDNVGLSSPGHWFVEFLFKGFTDQVETPDGNLWSVGPADQDNLERIQRIDAAGVVDRGAELPLSPSTATPLRATGPMTALQDGSLMFVATDGHHDFTVRYVPTAFPSESVWTGAGGDGRWSTSTNWQGGVVPRNGSVVVLTGTGTITDDLPSLQLQELLLWTSIHLAGGPFSVGSDGIEVDGGAAPVIGAAITTPAGTSLTLRADLDSTLTVSGVISGAGGVTSDGSPLHLDLPGSLVRLTGNNTYTGETVDSVGPLSIDGTQPASAVLVDGQLTGGGTTGSVDVDGSIDYADAEQFYGVCPQTLTVDGNLVFEKDSGLFTAIESCGTPSAQTIGTVLVTGTATIDAGAGLGLTLGGDKPQVACLLSSQGALHGQFKGAGQGATQHDPSGGKVVYSYDTPGGSGCYANAFTATTGVH